MFDFLKRAGSVRHEDAGRPGDHEREGPGMAAARALAAGTPTPEQAARLFEQHPGERDAIAGFLQRTLGNAFVAEIEGRTGKLDLIDAGGGGAVAAIRSVAANQAQAQAQSGQSTSTAAPKPRLHLWEEVPADVHALLSWFPDGSKGEQGEAAWLLAAIAAGFIEVYIDNTTTQLEAFASGSAVIRTKEKARDAKKEHRIEGVKKVKGGVYDVEIDEAPILEVLVSLVRTRIWEWRDAGMGKRAPLLRLGTLVRADTDKKFPGKDPGSDHTFGSAVDLGFDTAKDDEGVAALIDDLEPGAIQKVVPDFDDHLHLAKNGDEYSFGMPFQGKFFRETDKLSADKARKLAGTDRNKEVQAEGLILGRSSWFKSTWREQGGVWKWTEPSPAGRAAPHLVSGRVKDALARLPESDGDVASLPGHDFKNPKLIDL